MRNVPAGHQQNFILSPFADHSSPAFFPANARVSGGHGSSSGLGFGGGLGSAGCFAGFFAACPLPSFAVSASVAANISARGAGMSIFEEGRGPFPAAGPPGCGDGSGPDPTADSPGFEEVNNLNPTTNDSNPKTPAVTASPRRRRPGFRSVLGGS